MLALHEARFILWPRIILLVKIALLPKFIPLNRFVLWHRIMLWCVLGSMIARLVVACYVSSCAIALIWNVAALGVVQGQRTNALVAVAPASGPLVPICWCTGQEGCCFVG
jgi:hypothetical protein